MKDFAWRTAYIDGIFLRDFEGALFGRTTVPGSESKHWSGLGGTGEGRRKGYVRISSFSVSVFH